MHIRGGGIIAVEILAWCGFANEKIYAGYYLMTIERSSRRNFNHELFYLIFCFTEEEIAADRFPAYRYYPDRFLVDHVRHEFRLRFQLRAEIDPGPSNHPSK